MNTSSHNYNKDLAPRLFGRDASGKTKPSAAPADATGTQQKTAVQRSEKPKSKDAPEYRKTEVAIVVPSDGLKKDQPFDISGKVQPLAGTLTKKKVRIDLITRYKGTEDKFATVEADISGDNSFSGSCKQLFYHDGYQRDKEKPADAKFTLEAKASGAGAEKEVISKTVDLPMATSTIILNKGKYDDAWSSKNEATHPKSGKEFVPDNKVKKLQDNLVTFRFLKKDQVTGMFDDATDAAVKKFQELAKKPERKKAGDVKLIKAEKITFDGDADGVVGEKTEKDGKKAAVKDDEKLKGNRDGVGDGASIEKCLTDETYEFDMLYAALVFNKIDLVKYVLRNKMYASVNKVYSEEAETPLTLACDLPDNKEALELSGALIALGANVNGAGESGGERTAYPLIAAINHHNVELTKLLRKHGADKEIKNESAETPLMIAQKKGFEDIVGLLNQN
jgi:hypothetical protein